MARARRYWRARRVGACVALFAVLPLFLPYLRLQQSAGVQRELKDAGQYCAADWSDYLAELGVCTRVDAGPPAGHWQEVVVSRLRDAIVRRVWSVWFACSAIRAAANSLALYGGLRSWRSGRRSDLTRPVLGAVLRRADVRAGCARRPVRLVVVFGLSVLAGDRRSRHGCAGAAGQRCSRRARRACDQRISWCASTCRPVPPVDRCTGRLATLPRGPLIEMPFFYRASSACSSTLNTCWRRPRTGCPLVNGYSDYIPPDFTSTLDAAGAVSRAATRSRSARAEGSASATPCST